MTTKLNLNIISQTPSNKRYNRPLVFIHGMFQGSWVWEENFLSYFVDKGFECHLLNLRGHNGSIHTGQFRFISIMDYVNDLTNLIEGLEKEPILIGHSMGGFIIQKYLEKHRIPLSILIAPVPPNGMYIPTFKIMVTKPHLFLLGNIILSMEPLVRDKKLLKKLMFTLDMDEELYDKFYPKHQNESFRAYLEMLIFRWVRKSKIISDMEFIGCENDYAISPKSVQNTARKYGKQAKIFPVRGHTPMIEEGWEDVADHIYTLLENHLNTRSNEK